MIELPLILVAGVLGSSHCVGMCGPFALSIGAAANNWRSNLLRQLFYSLGRVFTYTVLGAIAGVVGMQLHAATPHAMRVPALLSIGTGVCLIVLGWQSARGAKLAVNGTAPCLGGSFLTTFLRGRTQLDMFLAGMLTGFLPCGLVYGFLAVAAGSGSLQWGAAVMATFGAGTIPVMVATGYGGALLSVAARTRLLGIAAWCVILAGFISVARGIAFWSMGTSAGSSCPLCP